MATVDTNITDGSGKSNWLKAEVYRLYSGVILMTYLTLHLINHALGLISLDAMEMGRGVADAIWRSTPGTILLIGAFCTHILLVSARLLSYRSYRRIPLKEVLQILGGLSIPLLMITHIVGTRVMYEVHGIEDSYAYVLYSIWIATPIQAFLQSLGLTAAWLHGCLGLYFWLRFKPWYEKTSIYLYSAALILPILALCGFINGANEVEVLFRDAQWRQSYFAALNLTQADIDWAYNIRDNGLYVIVGCLLVLLASRVFWYLYFRSAKLIFINYPEGKKVATRPGTTVLEASRIGNIPHASVCGGRGRCSTCRVRITAGADSLPTPADKEYSVLKRVKAAEGTRLACQLRPMNDISVIPLLPAKASPRNSFARPDYLHGQEKNIVILFADLRAFTKFSEHKLPYDVVFVINQYFRHMGEAIEKSGGHLDKFIGDGVMALFGLDDNSDRIAALKALSAAKAMAKELDIMNQNLASDLDEPLKIGIGLHMGPVIVGEMGYGKATSITAIGDAVNTASRLEAMNKENSSQLIFSDEIAKAAGYSGPSKIMDATIRGRKDPMTIHIIEDAKELDLHFKAD